MAWLCTAEKPALVLSFKNTIKENAQNDQTQNSNCPGFKKTWI